MIDLVWFDLLLLGLAALGYVLRPRVSRVVFHDPISASLAGFLATDVGLGTTLGTIGAGAIEGGALGAGVSALTGGDPLKGGLFGALGGGAIGGVGSLFSDVGAGAAGATSSALDPATAATGGLYSAPGAALDTAASAGGVGAGPASGATVASQVASAATPAGAPAGGALAPAATTIVPSDASAALSPTVAGGVTTGGGSAGGGALSGGPSGGSFLGLVGSDATTPAGTTLLSGPDATASAQAAGAAAAPATSGVSSFLGKNWPILASGGLMGVNYLMGNKPLPAQQQLQEAADEQATLGKTLAGYSLTGTLPPGMKAIVDQNTNAAKAAIRSQYASLGYAGSTAEVQALHQVDEAATAQIAQLANQLLQQGRSFSALSDQEFATLLQTQLAQEQGLQNAIARFAGGLAGAKVG